MLLQVLSVKFCSGCLSVLEFVRLFVLAEIPYSTVEDEPTWFSCFWKLLVSSLANLLKVTLHQLWYFSRGHLRAVWLINGKRGAAEAPASSFDGG